VAGAEAKINLKRAIKERNNKLRPVERKKLAVTGNSVFDRINMFFVPAPSPATPSSVECSKNLVKVICFLLSKKH
jgi:hypothetical protein